MALRFRTFIQELKDNFGSYNPVGEAEAELEGLHMQENHQATKDFIKFMQLATWVHGGEPCSNVRLTMS